LVAGGATVLGPRPIKSPSLTGYPQADDEIQNIASELWGDTDGVSRTKHQFGKGWVVWGLPPAEVLAGLRVPKDVEYSRALDAPVAWIHRYTSDADIYFIASRSDQPQDVEMRFRIALKEPELWHADTGAIERPDYDSADHRTTVPLHLSARESVFVVFRRASSSPSRTSTAASVTTLATIDGPWTISFLANPGASSSIQVPALASWTASAEEGVKYFSGTATYAKTFNAPRAWFRPGAQIVLDLGTVGDLAEVSLNGKSLGSLWKMPYTLDVTQALKPGDNKLEIKVTNEWTNRIIGDRLGPADNKVLNVPAPPPGAPAPSPVLPVSGLIGPVKVVSVIPR